MAEANLRQKIEKSPKNANLHHDLGCLLYEKGDIGGALGSFLLALALKPKNKIFLNNALRLLGTTSGYKLPDSIINILAQNVSHDDIDIQSMSMVIHNQYDTSPTVGTLINVLNASEEDCETILKSTHFDAFFNDPLLLAVMQKAIIITPLLEIAFTKLRRHILSMSVKYGLSGHAMSPRINFIVSLACQCFNTEYAYDVTEAENDAVQKIIDPPSKDDLVLKWALMGCYDPLHQALPHIPEKYSPPSPVVKFFLKRQYRDFHYETALQKEIISLTEIKDNISQKVREQYERYPYPRWLRYSKSVPKTFAKFIEEKFPDQAKNNIRPYGSTDILIPGCGTGMQICTLASTISKANITALDISRTSLAYAMRAVKENGFNLRNIKFFHADIMALNQCDLTFDYIDCTGVLHHLGNPERGLENLVNILRESGFMRLALYSERGRKDVINARKFIQEQGINDSEDGVRAFRKAVRSLAPDHPMASIAHNQDFYSISGLHDLVFNVNENRYTPRDIKAILNNAGLQFLGFDHIDSRISPQYALQFPEDKLQRNLENWENFEKNHPNSFGFMYHFWCRKI
ncbi:MAG: class I SAM-dependent methyltransferase [Emcibacter sp.]|nr:class I SAM-dependent methyltransferase [Emcibacter sp.]